MKQDALYLKPLLNTTVLIENARGARYEGVLSKIEEANGRFCLTRLKIHNQAGAILASKHDTKRWFKLDHFRITPIKRG